MERKACALGARNCQALQHPRMKISGCGILIAKRYRRARNAGNDLFKPIQWSE